MDYKTPPPSPRVQGQQAKPPLAPMRENLVARPVHLGPLNFQGAPALPGHVFPAMGPATQQP